MSDGAWVAVVVAVTCGFFVAMWITGLGDLVYAALSVVLFGTAVVDLFRRRRRHE